jgi:rod shape-determining protein MreD
MGLKIEREAVAQQTGTPVARLLPIATTLLTALLSFQPVHLPGYATLTPAFALMSVYHWTIYRPDLLQPLALFGIGLAYDLISGNPPGVTPLLFLLSRATLLRCRHLFVHRTFPFVWGGFTLLTAVAMLGLWALHSALTLQFAGFSESVLRAALTVVLFPILSFLLGRAQYALLGAGRSCR